MIIRFPENFLAKKRKSLSEEEKKKRNEKAINKYCKRNDEMFQLLEKLNNGEITHKNIYHMNSLIRLLSTDLIDTKKIINPKALIFNQKKEIFEKVFNLTHEERQFFWYYLTDGELKEGKAQDINSRNISKAKKILKYIKLK